ncbi:hypothetical protein J8F10_32095 [Gemmata sp. G18]|uniref:Uncharacterized protein n=1 Tax=Gemmata palustris TaxID=2822762 RepID=A0ABS5C215_9BACT|nr:hypothetical protein [Gemmata palustris]MBP3959910.1 hypothetical protein [Gemmata palustris]
MVPAIAARRVLVPWIGYADFRALAATLPPDQQADVLRGLNPPTPLTGQAGPLKTLLDHEPFDEVHLPTSHPARGTGCTPGGSGAAEHIRAYCDPSFHPEVPFDDWEVELHPVSERWNG